MFQKKPCQLQSSVQLFYRIRLKIKFFSKSFPCRINRRFPGKKSWCIHKAPFIHFLWKRTAVRSNKKNLFPSYSQCGECEDGRRFFGEKLHGWHGSSYSTKRVTRGGRYRVFRDINSGNRCRGNLWTLPLDPCNFYNLNYSDRTDVSSDKAYEVWGNSVIKNNAVEKRRTFVESEAIPTRQYYPVVLAPRIDLSWYSTWTFGFRYIERRYSCSSWVSDSTALVYLMSCSVW